MVFTFLIEWPKGIWYGGRRTGAQQGPDSRQLPVILGQTKGRIRKGDVPRRGRILPK